MGHAFTRLVLLVVTLASAPTAGAVGFWDPRPRHGGQAAFGMGLIGASVSGGGTSVAGASGSGVQLVGELRLTERLAWDLRLGGFWITMGAPTEINYPADDGDYALASTGLHYDFARVDAGAFWAGAEASLHYASMSNYFYSVGGFGAGPVLGVDLVIRGPLTFRASAHLSWVSLSSNYGDKVGSARVLWGGIDLLYLLP